MMEDGKEPVYASKAKPWLKYYEEKYIHQSVPECSAFALVCRNNERHLGDTALEYYGRKFSYADLIVQIKKTAAALQAGITPVQVKEILYQSVAYLGIGRVRPFFSVTNQVLTEQGVALPLEPGSTTTAETRLAAGNQAQVDIFGEGMRGFQNSGPEESRHINRWLADNCFGDYYTRGGLDYKQREMITFCFLAALGGCEPQLTSHAGANLRIGNDNAFLIQVISQCLPYIGYPRSLNALRCVNDAAQAAR